jgi:FkbM family methyltransferase
MSAVIKEINGMNMHLDINDGGISSALFTNGIREAAFMAVMDDAVKHGMTCIDLGANIGYATLLMLRNVGETGNVYAIEPDPHNLVLLHKNITENNFEHKCEIIECAMSDENGNLEFWQSSRPNCSSVQKTKHSTKKIKVPCYTLTSFLENRKYPNFIKMDIEGHETQVFEGGLDYFKNNNEGETNILLEVHPQFYSKDNDFAKILQEYFNIGFKSQYVISTPVPQPKLFKERGYTPFQEIPTDGVVRGIYTGISNNDLVEFACKENIEDSGRKISKKIVRSFMLRRDQ